MGGFGTREQKRVFGFSTMSYQSIWCHKRMLSKISTCADSCTFADITSIFDGDKTFDTDPSFNKTFWGDVTIFELIFGESGDLSCASKVYKLRYDGGQFS